MAQKNVLHVTPCVCVTEGWCSRHACLKPRELFLLCQRSQELFDLWEEKRGPGQRRRDRSADHPSLKVLTTPCRHRSPEPVDQIECRLCGSGNKLVPVFDCVQFGRCTKMATGNRSEYASQLATCFGCSEYEASVLSEKQ